MNKYPPSMQKESDTSIVNRDAKPLTAVIDAATFTSLNGQKWMNLSDDEIERCTSVL